MEYALAEDFEEMLKIFEADNLSEFVYNRKNGEWQIELY